MWIEVYASLDLENIEPLMAKNLKGQTYPKSADTSEESRLPMSSSLMAEFARLFNIFGLARCGLNGYNTLKIKEKFERTAVPSSDQVVYVHSRKRRTAEDRGWV